MISDDTTAWNAYWDEPRLAACFRGEEGNYGGEIASRWNRFFASLPSHSRILDIATGNGAIALFALNCSERLSREFTIDAIDAAAIDPARALPELRSRLDRISFHSGVKSERLPFEDNSFDAVVGQYALEYTDRPRTIAEIARVLSPGGKLMFITHTEDSEVFANTIAQLDSLRKLSELELVGRVESLIRLDASSDEAEYGRRLDDFKRHAAVAMRRLDASSGPDRSFIMQFLRGLGDLYQARHEFSTELNLEKLGSLAFDLDSHGARLMALKGAALDKSEISELQDILEKSGFTHIESAPVIDPSSGSKQGQKFIAILHQ